MSIDFKWCSFDRDQVVETFAAKRPDKPFTKPIGGGHPRRRFQRAYPECLQGSIDFSGEDRVPVMDEEAVFVIGRQELSKLLDGPFGRRMLSDIAVQDAARAGFHDDKYIHRRREMLP